MAPVHSFGLPHLLATIVIATSSPAPDAAPRILLVRELPGDSTHRDIAAHVLPLRDGALVTGWTARTGAAQQGLVIRVDADANPVWRRELGGAGVDLLFAAQPAASGGFVCAGFTNGSGAGGTDGWVVAIDSAGVILWERTFGGPGDERLTSLQPARDGWMAAGQTARDGNTDAWVVRLDREGRDLGAWTWGGAGVERGLAVQPLPDGGCVVAGVAGADRETADGFVTRLGPDGRPAWTHTVGGAGFQVAYQVRAVPDGSLLVTGYGYRDAARDHDAYVLGLGADGRVRFRRDMGGEGYDRATQSVPRDDGSIVTVGYGRRAGAADGDPVWQTVLHGTTASGLPSWSIRLGGAGLESGHGIAASEGNLWVVAQSSPAGGGSRVLVARLDASTAVHH